MKKVLLMVSFIFLFSFPYTNVEANIKCKDGSYSKTCTECHSGCCSDHDGCEKNEESNDGDDDWLKYVAVGTGGAAAGYGASKILNRKKGETK